MSQAVRAKVLLVEDDVLVRRAVARILSVVQDFDVVAEAGTVAQAREKVAMEPQLDLALVDLSLPDGRGIDIIRLVRARHPTCVPIALTAHDEPAIVFEALRAGARGYLLKGTAPSDLPDLLREAMAGGAPLSPAVASMVVRSFENQDVREPLTPRELDVLQLLVKGLSYKQVAATLGVGTGTVQTHVKSLYDKLEVSSKAEATMVAMKQGLV